MSGGRRPPDPLGIYRIRDQSWTLKTYRLGHSKCQQSIFRVIELIYLSVGQDSAGTQPKRYSLRFFDPIIASHILPDRFDPKRLRQFPIRQLWSIKR
jgi:hypothetical protein